MITSISIPKEHIPFRTFTRKEWSGYPKDDFDKIIRRWCSKHNFMQHVATGETVPARLPYKLWKDDVVAVAEDFLQMVEKHRVNSVFRR